MASALAYLPESDVPRALERALEVERLRAALHGAERDAELSGRRAVKYAGQCGRFMAALQRIAAGCPDAALVARDVLRKEGES